MFTEELPVLATRNNRARKSFVGSERRPKLGSSQEWQERRSRDQNIPLKTPGQKEDLSPPLETLVSERLRAIADDKRGEAEMAMAPTDGDSVLECRQTCSR